MLNSKLQSLTQVALGFSLVSLLATSPLLACTTGSAESTKVARAASSSIVDIAASDDSFSTLVAALKAAGLTDVLNGDTNFTVFAPTNAAFAALPEGTVETLLRPENKDTLVQILTYHVVPGSVLSTALSTGSVTTVAGPDVNIDLSQGVVVNNARVVQADVKASNGVIHVIDKVLLPPQQ
ncbi:MAG: fasciclin domain-containing protein [Cyanobacteria bacterium P01_F01_bin.3]